MSEKITKEETSEAADALTALIESDQISGAEEKVLREALATVWNIHDRVEAEESK